MLALQGPFLFSDIPLPYLAALACLALSGAWILYYRQNKVLATAFRKEIERQHMEISLLRDQVDSGNIRYHLNPHFVFNSLNNLQYFINSGEKRIALSYVSRFSKFMRQLILLAGEPTGSLYDEASILKQYLELEKIRFEDRFDYAMELPEQLQGVHITLPALTLYHLAESIIYGRVLNSLNAVQITINFECGTEHISMMVQDDITAAQGMNHTQPNRLKEHIEKLNEENYGRIAATHNVVKEQGAIKGSILEVKFYFEAGRLKERAA